VPQLYFDLARDQWSAWEARRKKWWDDGRAHPLQRDFRQLEAILERLFYWREIATPHGSASRYVVA
jgi:hypothetical protein